MDEPMEDGIQNNEITSNQPDLGKTKPVSVMRPGGMVMMTITIEDYETEYWPRLEHAISQLLTLSPGDYTPISYEQMYSCVYKCVCKQFSERLYGDLLKHTETHLQKVSQELHICLREKSPHEYVQQFGFATSHYLQALTGVVPIFNYMNRFYIESKLKTDLNTELRKLFTIKVAEEHIQVLLPLLAEAQVTPFAVAPPIMATLVKNLYSLNPEFCKLNPLLFAKYIPGVLPAASVSNLDQYIAETKHMQQDIVNSYGYDRGDQSRKRPTEEDLPKSAPVSFMPKNPTCS